MIHLEIWLLALALAMDCFTVSFSCGIIQKQMGKQSFVMAITFGLFQGLMPLIGWLLATLFYQHIETFDHWIAFGILLFLGGKMFIEGLNSNDKKACNFNPSKIRTIIALAIATSIDALAVGFSFSCMGLNNIPTITGALLTIAFVSFALSLTGKYMGVKIGKRFHLPAEKIGGIILIIIGVKILIQHLTIQ